MKNQEALKNQSQRKSRVASVPNVGSGPLVREQALKHSSYRFRPPEHARLAFPQKANMTFGGKFTVVRKMLYISG
jgi:hypothetical protein